MKRTTVSLPDDLAAALAREARRHDRSASEITRDALAKHLGRCAPPPRTGRNVAPRPAARRAATWRSCSWPGGMATLAIVDAGPLYAAADADDVDHVRGLGALDVEGPSAEDLIRMARLVEQYADFPLGVRRNHQGGGGPLDGVEAQGPAFAAATWLRGAQKSAASLVLGPASSPAPRRPPLELLMADLAIRRMRPSGRLAARGRTCRLRRTRRGRGRHLICRRASPGAVRRGS
jgi:hypothetical protein